MTEETRATRYTVISHREPVESLLEIKRSEFIGHVKRVESEAEARQYIESLRKVYHNARHVCSAFVIGADREIQRSSDDGEPAGTAGIPMLQALLSRRAHHSEGTEATDLSDICAVVVRYFGGIKLGAGGLVRAYTDAVVQVLDEAPLVTRQRLRLGEIIISHADAGRFENDLRSHGFTVIGTDYLSAHAVVRIGVADEDQNKEKANEQVAALSAGSATVTWTTTEWV
ncbi:YigZ family protein [Rothia sp. ZJ1223]|uniref:IMPACT family protein n=1 Tax=Rothia sp. ZJ1223 TaxID=2811098 RepID=UPI001959344E|nr:YigZ family protein [Rothia sp. ZJ1223]MBM7050640.1 YigZ family protein [Rothia sp. ZJ1223]